jgi:hypothetical protein
LRLARVDLSERPPWLPKGVGLDLPLLESAPARHPLPEGQVDLAYFLEERWRRLDAPASARLPFHYHRLPARLRLGLARLLAHRADPTPFPRAPFEPTLDAIRWARGERVAWPGGARCALLLTHDVDTARGASAIASVAELERALGVRSAFFVCSHHYPLDLDGLARLEREGFELASHGWNHDNRLAFLPAPERAARLDAIAARFRPRFALAGFRSPSTLRTPELLADLSSRFAWDSSIPDVDLELGGGCGTVLPYRIGRLLEIPITLPLESSLLYRGEAPARVFEAWTAKLDWIRRVGGVATAVLHTEPQLGGHPELVRRYADWVARVPPDVWTVTPRRLCAYLERVGFATLPPTEPEVFA